nr:protein mono-ADP-ribosyltransferase PARP11-like [Pocillopora verrucosa]
MCNHASSPGNEVIIGCIFPQGVKSSRQRENGYRNHREAGSGGTSLRQSENGNPNHREEGSGGTSLLQRLNGNVNHREAGSGGTSLRQRENGRLNNREEGVSKTRTREDEKRAREREGETSSLPGDSESTPYLWQFKEADSYPWKNFGPSDNFVLEELYCDVNNVEVEIELEDTTIRHSRKLSRKLSANFHTISMSLFSPLNHFLIRRRSTPSYIKERGNKFPTLWVWYWEDIDGWKKYAETNLCSGAKQEQIEASYLNGEPAYYFEIDGNTFVIHFEGTLMNQRSVDPEVQAVRLVRRRPMPAMSNPKGQVMAVKRTDLEKDSEEYRTVSEHFHETMPEHRASILMVEKITNGHLLQKYERKCQEMREQRKPMNEKFLFHGTTPDVVDAICTRNFDHRVCGKNGTRYGQGSYFAVDASYSNNYSNNYSKTEGDKTRYMFLVKVLTGEFIRAEEDFRRPPLKDPSNLAGDLYDSCVNDENLPKIFVIFDNEQCYPSYLIKYHLK